MAEIIDFHEIVRARTRRRSRALTVCCLDIMEACLAETRSAYDSAPPAELDYEMWTGPAPMKPFTQNRFHYNWHWIWDTGNGDFGNQGIHELDLAIWGLGVKYPTKVSAIGGHFMFDDDQETPNTQVSTFEFNEGGKKRLLVFEVRHWVSNHEAGIGESRGEGRSDPNTIGNIFYGSKGYLAVNRGYSTRRSVSVR